VRIVVTVIGCLWAAVVLALVAAHVFSPERSGPFALANVVEPLLWLSLLAFVPLAVIGTSHSRIGPTPVWTSTLRLLLLVALVVAAVRVGPNWLGPIVNGSAANASGGSAELGVTSWNLEADDIDRQALVQRIADSPDGVVVLVELSKADAAAIAADRTIKERFPTQLLYPDDGSTGMGLLTGRQVVTSGHRAATPAMVWARLDLGLGRQVMVVGAHPEPAQLDRRAGLPVPLDYDPTERDRQLELVRSTADGLVANDRAPLVLAGDFNVTDQEPAYADLSKGLIDSQLATAYGPGWTWRPDALKELPFGILRIDYVFGGNGATPHSLAVDCTPVGSDHCLLHGSVGVPGV
jgi:endonuclease/exonuclease/phosphatase family metal-dependent hydrolase